MYLVSSETTEYVRYVMVQSVPCFIRNSRICEVCHGAKCTLFRQKQQNILGMSMYKMYLVSSETAEYVRYVMVRNVLCFIRNSRIC